MFIFLLPVATAGLTAFPQATIYVYPEKSEVKVGETFTVDINIRNVSRLQGLDFRLTYDTCVLDALKVVEGPFMASGGSTFVIKMEVKDEIGQVWVAIVILGEGWANGTGTLATITFKATAAGETFLNLSSEICTCGPQSIPHTNSNGYVTVSADPADPPDPADLPDPPNLDVNRDGIFDVFDVVTVARAFGSKSGDVNWNSLADLNDNNVVDIYDAILVVQNFGQE